MQSGINMSALGSISGAKLFISKYLQKIWISATGKYIIHNRLDNGRGRAELQFAASATTDFIESRDCGIVRCFALSVEFVDHRCSGITKAVFSCVFPLPSTLYSLPSFHFISRPSSKAHWESAITVGRDRASTVTMP